VVEIEKPVLCAESVHRPYGRDDLFGHTSSPRINGSSLLGELRTERLDCPSREKNGWQNSEAEEEAEAPRLDDRDGEA
jgi:hypothetical protein